MYAKIVARIKEADQATSTFTGELKSPVVSYVEATIEITARPDTIYALQRHLENFELETHIL